MIEPRATRRFPASPAAALALLALLAPPQARAQEQEGWNAPEALALIARARDARQADAVDPERRAYQATATGHVFFLADRPTTGERTLIKADQIAIEVYWKAPRATRQRIIGQRDQKVLPTNIRYHLDHLTVVQDDFGDVIRIGDGDEVSSVAHPAAPGAERIYDFALGDAIAIAFPEGGEVQVQEIRVRPRALDRPGFVGSVYVDRASAAVVRMTFTFTPASYVDSYLDYIRISLDNLLWEGRWWLPYKQEIEIRRELPQLDFLVGSVIRGRFDVGDYVLNPDLPDDLFTTNRVTIVPEAERRAYAFTEPLVPPVESAELTPTPTLQQVRAQAVQLTAGRYLSGLSRFRPYLPTASDVIRWNRAEGAFVGAGAAWRPTGDVAVKGNGGWAFGRGEPALSVTLEDGEGRAGMRGTWNQLRDLGPLPGAPGAVNTLSALLADEDWLDPWFSSGLELSLATSAAGVPTRFRLFGERHYAGSLVLDVENTAEFRPLPSIEEGWIAGIEARGEPRLPGALALAVTGRWAALDPQGPADRQVYGVLTSALSWERGTAADLRLLGQLDAGVDFGIERVPSQERFYLGGRGTLPGHPYRAQDGDVFWLVRAEASRDLLRPWLTGRAVAAAGQAGELAHSSEDAPFVRDGMRASAGAGLGLLWDVLHLDLARGLNGGEWELVVSVDRRFRGWL